MYSMVEHSFSYAWKKSPLPLYERGSKEGTCQSLLNKEGVKGIFKVIGIMIAGEDLLYPA